MATKKAMLIDNVARSDIRYIVCQKEKADRELDTENCYRDLQPVIR